jgi:hypothetical protein
VCWQQELPLQDVQDVVQLRIAELEIQQGAFKGMTRLKELGRLWPEDIDPRLSAAENYVLYMRQRIIEVEENADQSSNSTSNNEILEEDAEDVVESTNNGDRDVVSASSYVTYKIKLILIISMAGKKRLPHKTAWTLSCDKSSQLRRFISSPMRSEQVSTRPVMSSSSGPAQSERKPGTWSWATALSTAWW